MCERLPARLPANAPHWHVSVCVNHRCLFLPLSGLLQTSHGSLSVSLPGASAAQVTQGGMTSMPHIHQTARSSRREQTELNLGSYYSVQADCSKLCKNLVSFIFHQKFGMITYFLIVSRRHLGVVYYSQYLNFPAKVASSLTCQYLFYLHANVWNTPCNGLSWLSGSNVEGNISSLTSALCNSDLIHLAAVP